MKILAFAGKMQSGKTTKVNFVVGHLMKQMGTIEDFSINERGELLVTALYYDDKGKPYKDMGNFPLNQMNEQYYEYMTRNVWPYVKNYNFVDNLKNLAMTFGLTWEQCYGDQEQKNSLTPLMWENMPGFAQPDVCKYIDPYSFGLHNKTGPMTGREFLQFLGTEVFRRIDNDYWPRNLKNTILAENSNLAVVGDLRFKNEFDCLKEMGAKLVYLTRNSENVNDHASENDLNRDMNWDWVLDNSNLTIEESNYRLLRKLTDWDMAKLLKKEKFTGTKL